MEKQDSDVNLPLMQGSNGFHGGDKKGLKAVDSSEHCQCDNEACLCSINIPDAENMIVVNIPENSRMVEMACSFPDPSSCTSPPICHPGSHSEELEMDICIDKDSEQLKKMAAMECDSYEDTSESSSSYGGDSGGPGCMIHLETLHAALEEFYLKHQNIIKTVFYITLALLYAAYFIAAVILDHRRSIPLIVITCLVVMGLVFTFLRDRFGEHIHKACMKPLTAAIGTHWKIVRWFVYLPVIGSVSVYIIVSVWPYPKQFVSLAGMATFIFLLFIFSKHPSKVSWRPVLWGLFIQFLMGVLILRTSWGYLSFRFLGEKVQLFLGYTDVGVRLVFGDNYMDHFFAFKVLPVIIFFSAVISTLYHLGVMQTVISKIAWVMQKTMRTSATESLTAAGNIFVGQTESPLLVRPFIKEMTKSELHAMMTAGFATIAGGVLAAYILFGVPAEHLLCASVMNAPVALAVAKLFYPETEVSRIKLNTVVMEEGKARNVLEAASAGASASIKLVANIAANLIAFLALLEFINAVMSWMGSMVGYPEFTFQVLCSYVFTPLAFLMGVEWDDCFIVAQLLGMKTFVNEFVAYEELSKYIKNRKLCDGPMISRRSETIATYALCGFANMSSIGIQLGGIGPMAPSRKGDLAGLAIRALIAGTTACFITASLAGVLTIEEPHSNRCLLGNDTMIININSTIDILNSTAAYNYNLTAS